MSRASGLYRLQQIDLESDRLKERLDEIRTTLEDSAEIAQLSGVLESKQMAMDNAGTAARRAENEVEDQRVKIEDTEQTLYGGSVTNPKELEDLQMESESLKRYLETLEDRYLEVMIEQDEAASELEQSSAELEAAKERQAGLHGELLTERDGIHERLTNLEAEREVALASISADDLGTYEDLKGRLRGVAIVVLDGDSCGACGLTLSASSRQLVGTGDELTRCTQCGRILYGG